MHKLELPEGYALTGTLDLMKDKKLYRHVVTVTSAGTLLLLAVGVALALFVPPFKITMQMLIAQGMRYLLLFFALQFVAVFVHELVHAAFMLVFARRVKIGLKLPYAYAAAPGRLLTKAQYLCVAAAPFVLINAGLAVAMFLFSPMTNLLLFLLLAVHLPACYGDIYVCAAVLNMPADTLTEDRGTDMRFFRPAG